MGNIAIIKNILNERREGCAKGQDSSVEKDFFFFFQLKKIKTA